MQVRRQLGQRHIRPVAPQHRARLSAIQDELSRRRARVGRAVDVEPPRYLAAELGPVPERLSERRVWQRTARRIAIYREDFAVTDPDRAIGAETRDLRQREAWRITRGDIDETQTQLQAGRRIDRVRSRDIERDLG